MTDHETPLRPASEHASSGHARIRSRCTRHVPSADADRPRKGLVERSVSRSTAGLAMMVGDLHPAWAAMGILPSHPRGNQRSDLEAAVAVVMLRVVRQPASHGSADQARPIVETGQRVGIRPRVAVRVNPVSPSRAPECAWAADRSSSASAAGRAAGTRLAGHGRAHRRPCRHTSESRSLHVNLTRMGHAYDAELRLNRETTVWSSPAVLDSALAARSVRAADSVAS
jgi:hypothetical protein